MYVIDISYRYATASMTPAGITLPIVEPPISRTFVHRGGTDKPVDRMQAYLHKVHTRSPPWQMAQMVQCHISSFAMVGAVTTSPYPQGMSFSFGVHVEYLPKSTSSPRPHDSHESGAMKVVMHWLWDVSHVDSKTLIANGHVQKWKRQIRCCCWLLG